MTTVACPACHNDSTARKDGKPRRHPCVPSPNPADIALPWPRPTLSKNEVRRTHYQAEAKARRLAIDEARWAIRAARRELVPYADVTLHWRMPNRGRRDGDGAQWQLSVCLDALVEEGVLHDDSWVCVRHSGVTTHAPEPGMPGGMWLEVSEVEENADAS